MEYLRLARGFPGWDLVHIKELPVRERQFWVAVTEYRRELEQWQQMTNPQQGANLRSLLG